MARINELRPVFVEYMPKEKEEGILYISERFNLAIHLCACGCKRQTVTPFNGRGWALTNSNGLITLRPSIGNWKWEKPYHAHYYITDNKIQWL